MTSIQEHVDRAVAAARSVKEDRVMAWHGPDDPIDIVTTMLVFRRDEYIATVFLREGGRDPLLAAAHGLIFGFAADVFAVVNETYKTRIEFNPLTGKHWEPGEMQQAAEQHDGIAKGWVSESLQVLVVNRQGELGSANIGYVLRRVESPLGLGWSCLIDWPADEGWNDEKVVVGGFIPDMLREFMAEPGFDEKLRQEPYLAAIAATMTDEQVMAHHDAAVVKSLTQHPSMPEIALALVCEPGTERAAILEESLGNVAGMLTEIIAPDDPKIHYNPDRS